MTRDPGHTCEEWPGRRLRGLWPGRADVSRYGVLKERSHSPRRVVIRRDARIRTPDARLWRPSL